MEPIINPWFIYAIGVADNLKAGMDVLVFLGWAFFIVSCVGHVIIHESTQNLRWRLKMCIMLLLSLISFCIPSKETLIGMAVAQNVTKDRVVTAGKMAVQAHDAIKKDVLDLILAIKSEEKKQATGAQGR